jgi:hypothetical protein
LGSESIATRSLVFLVLYIATEETLATDRIAAETEPLGINDTLSQEGGPKSKHEVVLQGEYYDTFLPCSLQNEDLTFIYLNNGQT